MIIQIRGTSGSGKSTVMREVMKRTIEKGGEWDPVFIERRKQPMMYRCGQLIVLGHYESACGGCDTLGSAKTVYSVIEKVQNNYTRVELNEYGEEIVCEPIILCEGLLLSEDTKWSSLLDDLYVVFLTTGLDTCLERIAGRRRAAGNDKPLNPANTSNRVAVIERARLKLKEKCVVRRATSTQAPDIVLSWIRSELSKG